MDHLRRRRLASGLRILTALAVVAAVVSTEAPGFAIDRAADQSDAAASTWKDPDLNPLPFQSDAEVLEFLGAARIESVAEIELGVTNPRRVVLVQDGIRMRAALRDYDETFSGLRFDDVFYSRLRDSYEFDVPAYQLSLLLGMNNIPPVTFRRIGASRVSLQVWLEGGLMETDRIAEGISPPSFQRFRRQTQNMRVFDSLIGNVDRNSGNILMDGDWNVWLIDHSRSFTRDDDIKYLDRIQSCSRRLFERIKTLTVEEMSPVMSPPLTASEIDWLLRRRDKVVAHIEALIEEKGDEDLVLFDDSR